VRQKTQDSEMHITNLKKRTARSLEYFDESFARPMVFEGPFD